MIKKVTVSELHPLITETLQNDAKVIITITGTSMLPLLRHKKDRVSLVKPQEQPLKKYDIPLFLRKDGKYILHRIIKVTPEGYGVVGDNQDSIEYPVGHSQLIGVVEGIFRGNRYISCDSVFYRYYCRIWVAAFPLRRLYFKGKKFLSRAIKFFQYSEEIS